MCVCVCVCVCVFIPVEFFTSALVNGFSLEFE